MKKLPLGLAACLLLTGCNDMGKNSGGQPDTLATTEVKNEAEVTKAAETPQTPTFATETMTIEKVGPQNMNVHFKFVVDYPLQGPDVLVQKAKQTIMDAFGKYKTTDDSQKGLDLVGQGFVDKAVSEIKEFCEEVDGKYNMGYGFDGDIRIFENTKKYVTYKVDSYLYTGGAHGMPQKYYVTLDKETGKELGWDDVILKDKHEALSKVVKKAIETQYYKGETHHWDDIFKFVLPEQPPTITADGLLFNYSSYEIDCYAAGMPFCTIPYEEAKTFMTPEALNYIP